MKQILRVLAGVVLVVCVVTVTAAVGASKCDGLPTEAQLKVLLNRAAANPADPGIPGALGGAACTTGFPSGTGCVGGLFGGSRMWGAVVNRDGDLCAFATSTADPTDTWPGSQAIAKAKAETANDFSNNLLPLSTANLYTFTQPGHSLYGLNNSNPFDPKFLAEPDGKGGGKGKVVGGIITFGGGVPLYFAGSIIGALGVSGDTACADHEIAKRVRHLAGLNPFPLLADDIVYVGPSVVLHPKCLNTVHNGSFIGSETPAPMY